MTNREPFFSVTADDCEFKDTFGSGAGGQHRNKKATAIRCTHRPSGAVGFSQEERSQRMNKETAFRRMAETKEFQLWIKMQVAIKTGVEKQIEENVERQMRKQNFKTEVKNERGLWVETTVEDLYNGQ